MIGYRRNCGFDSRVTMLHTGAYSCLVMTAGEGRSEESSTLILEMPPGELESGRAVARIRYVASLRPEECLLMHDVVAKFLDESGESLSLADAVSAIGGFLKGRGLAAEVIAAPR